MANPSQEMGVFERVAERGSFAGAAQDTGLTPSAVSKLVTRLEQRLGVRLLTRTTRRLVLTSEGETFLGRSREILAAIDAAEAEVASARLSARGQLRVLAPPVLAVDQLAPILPAFLARHPRITFDFLVTNRVVDLVKENVDIGLQTGALSSSTLVARKIADLAQVICASPHYLARHGRPEVPSDLARHTCLTMSGIRASDIWRFRVNDRIVPVSVIGSASADSADMLVRLAIEGVGIVRLGEIAVASAIQKGLLQPLLQDTHQPENYPLWAVMPPGRQRALKVKVFLDFLSSHFATQSWRAGAAIALRMPSS
jgi:DNA-binding transcriptional LysR family regulator